MKTHRHSLLRWMWHVCRHGRPEKILYFHGGLGDQLLCTAVARELTKRKARGIWWLSDYPALVRSNPDFPVIIAYNDGLARWANFFKVPYHQLVYQKEVVWDEKVVPPVEPLIAVLCRQAGITGEIGLRPYWPTLKHGLPAKGARPRVAIHSSCMNARYPVPNKQWPLERIQQVVNRLVGEVDFVQLGDLRDPLLQGVADARGCEISKAASILSSADLFLGMVGFLMHLARAVDCPGVIVYGGREPAAISGYSCNMNLESRPPCSPCWFFERCDYQRLCLTDISVGQVVQSVKSTLSQPRRRPLPHDKFRVQ